MEPIKIIRVGNTLGEGVLWNVETQSLWWTDIEERCLYRYTWSSQSLTRLTTPERLCSFGFVHGSDRLIAAFESGFALYDPIDGATAWLARPEAGRFGLRLNDGRVDRQGRFWAGSMAETAARAGEANLYCVDEAGHAHRREGGITISNGICWSPDSSTFYFADSPRRTIWQYAFDAASGDISDRRVFAETPEGALPDGANVDAEGFLWSAQWGAGRVVRYAPDGRIDRILEVPDSQPSCVAFGGPDLDLLFVTTARDGLKESVLKREINAGDVFVYNVGVAGLPDGRFLLNTSGILPPGRAQGEHE
jgi:sugar lactone lactonase YvrE